jgi:predicted RNA-binding Zn-ribbon protein involved in translation (DUF1610 family)
MDLHSTHAPTPIPCPSCGDVQTHDVATVVIVSENPELQDEIRRGRFQLHQCPNCGHTIYLITPMRYFDAEQGLDVLLLPEAMEVSWRAHLDTPATRVVFGMEALTEKVVCSAADLDDVWVEIAKIDCFRRGVLGNLSVDRRPRIHKVDKEGLHARRPSPFLIRHTRFEEIQQHPEAWEAEFKALGSDPYVDMGRILLPGA